MHLPVRHEVVGWLLVDTVSTHVGLRRGRDLEEVPVFVMDVLSSNVSNDSAHRSDDLTHSGVCSFRDCQG